MKNNGRVYSLLAVVASAWGLLVAGPSALASHGISAANIEVTQFDTGNTTNSVKVSAVLSINDFRILHGSNRGDYNVQIGTSYLDDVATGVLMTSVAQNGRDNLEAAYPGTNFCTSAMDYSRADGWYYIPTFNAPTGTEYNVNVAAAFFSYDRWLGGYARNSGDTNGGVNDLFTGSPGLVLGTHFFPTAPGVFTVDFRSLGIDSRTDGVLLVTGGENEDNFALSQANSADGTWTVWVRDNGSNQAEFEQDPVAFVYVPRTNASVISGKFQGDGAILLHSGETAGFAVTNVATGVWRLTISGQSPANGVLIISPEGGTAVSQDNMVTYEADGDGWVIQSRDLPPSPPGLQTPTGPVASFVFIPAAVVEARAPADGAGSMNTSPTLQVAVTNAGSGPLTVTFYGGKQPVTSGPDFCMAVLPDTQYYTGQMNGGTKEMLIAQTEWAIANRLNRNVAYVTQLGDLSNDGDTALTQFRNATNGFYRLEDPIRTQLADGIPYGIAVGNHDLYPRGDPSGTSIYFNRYFGVSHFAGKNYYGGHYGTNNNNHFDLFSASGLDFIVLYFEYYPGGDPAAIAWAQQVLSTNATRRIICVTHYMGTIAVPSSLSSQGLAIYNALKSNTNLFLMLGGHVSGEASRTDTYKGNTTYTFIQDYQSRVNGGNGWMRIFEFSPSNNVVTIQTYSPVTGQFETDADSEMYFPYNMQSSVASGEVAFVPVGTNSNVLPGAIASCAWPGLEAYSGYQWYVVVTDADGNTYRSGAWRFATAPNYAPVANNQLVNLPADTTSEVQMVASDPNGDALIYKTNSLPTRGIISDFNPATGLFNYTPARGFRGSDRFSFQVSDGVASSSMVTMNLNVVAPADSDWNGLPDAWEAQYGVSDPSDDPDGDGQTNLQEYSAGTNPTNAASVFRIISQGRVGNSFEVDWAAAGGTRYRVQYKNGDASGGVSGSFTDIVRSITLELDGSPYGTVTTQHFSEVLGTGATVPTNRYYRIRTAP